MVQRILRSSLIAVLAAGLITVSVEQAEARHGRGIFAGIAVGLVALAIISASRHRHHHRYVERRYAPEPQQQCEWRGRTCFDNKYGDHVCQGGEYSCRP